MSASALTFNIPSNSPFDQATAHQVLDNLTSVIAETNFDPNNFAKNIKFIIVKETGDCLSKMLIDLGQVVYKNTTEDEFDQVSLLVFYNIPQICKMLQGMSDHIAPFGWTIDKVLFSGYSHWQFIGNGYNQETGKKDLPKFGQEQCQLVIYLDSYLSEDGGKDGLALVPRCNNTPKEGTPFEVSSKCAAFEAPTPVRRVRGGGRGARQMDEDGADVAPVIVSKELPTIPSTEEVFKSNTTTVEQMIKHVNDNGFSSSHFSRFILWATRGEECTTMLHLSFGKLIKEMVYETLRTYKLLSCFSTEQTDQGKWIATPQEQNLVKELIAAYSTRFMSSLPDFMETLKDRSPSLLAANGWAMRDNIQCTVWDPTQFRGFSYSESGKRDKDFGASILQIRLPLKPLEGEAAKTWKKGPICCNAEKGYDSPHSLDKSVDTSAETPEAAAAPRAPQGTTPYRERALKGAAHSSAPVSAPEHLRDSVGRRFVPFVQTPRSAAGGGGRTTPVDEESVSKGRRFNRSDTTSASELETLRRRIAELEGGGARTNAGGGGRAYAGGGGGGATGRR
jgi:hypothetical protein